MSILARVLYFVAFAAAALGHARADDTVVARVLGEPITIEELRSQMWTGGAGAEDDVGALGQMLHSKIVGELVEAAIAEHGLEPTDEQLDSFSAASPRDDGLAMRALESQLEDTRRRLVDDSLTPDEREQLELQAEQAEQAIASLREIAGYRGPGAQERAEMEAELPELRRKLEEEPLSDFERQMLTAKIEENERYAGMTDEEAAAEWQKIQRESERRVAHQFVQGWLFSRWLYREYGGRVIFQQAGPEPIDAAHEWLREREEAGDFQILDASLQAVFWSYYEMDHSMWVMPEEQARQAMETPWWEMEPPE